LVALELLEVAPKDTAVNRLGNTAVELLEVAPKDTSGKKIAFLTKLVARRAEC